MENSVEFWFPNFAMYWRNLWNFIKSLAVRILIESQCLARGTGKVVVIESLAF
jgi:hypothetical protein